MADDALRRTTAILRSALAELEAGTRQATRTTSTTQSRSEPSLSSTLNTANKPALTKSSNATPTAAQSAQFNVNNA